MATELQEEFQARHEAEVWDLRKCPCCGGNPIIEELDEIVMDNIIYRPHGFRIVCGQFCCSQAIGKTLADAAAVWNQPRFSDEPQR